jgi:hypothetical protein
MDEWVLMTPEQRSKKNQMFLDEAIMAREQIGFDSSRRCSLGFYAGKAIGTS